MTLLYHITDVEIASFESDIYDRGVRLLETTHFIPTTYGFTLNQNPDGRITAGRILIIDPVGMAQELVDRFGNVILDRFGNHIFANEAELTQLETDIGMGDIFPQYFTDKVTPIDDFLDKIFEGVTGWYYVDELTEIHFGRLTDPDAESAPPFEFNDSNMVGKIKVEDDKAPGLSTRAAHGFSPGAYSEEELAGSVDGDDRGDLSNPVRIATTTEILVPVLWTADDASWTADSIIYTADGFAGEEVRVIPSYYWKAGVRDPINISISYCNDSNCDSVVLAQAEIDRWWSTLYNVRRRFYTFDAKLNDPMFNLALPQLGDFCTLQSDRFKLIDVPKNLFIRRLKQNLSKNLLTVEGWG